MDQLISEQKTALEHLENELDRGNKARRLLSQVYKMRQASELTSRAVSSRTWSNRKNWSSRWTPRWRR